MITTPLSAKLECLVNEDIPHSLFIYQNYRELQLWDRDKLKETLQVLESRGITFSSILPSGDSLIIHF
jgi:hypothetical protein